MDNILSQEKSFLNISLQDSKMYYINQHNYKFIDKVKSNQSSGKFVTNSENEVWTEKQAQHSVQI